MALIPLQAFLQPQRPASFVGPVPAGATIATKPKLSPEQIARDKEILSKPTQPSFFQKAKFFFQEGLPEAATKITSGAITGEKALVQSTLQTKLGQKATDYLSTKVSPVPTGLESSLNQTLFAESTPTLTDYGKQILPKFAQKGPIPFIAGLGLTALDFTGAGGEKGAIKALATTTKEAEAAKVLRQINVAEDLVKEYAPIIAKTSNESEVSKIISHIQELQDTTKTVETTKTAVDPFASLRKERGFITSIKQELPELKVAGQYIPRATDRLAIKAANLVKQDLPTAEKIALTESNDKAVAVASELLKHYADEATKTTGVVQTALYDKAANVGNTIARRLTEQGRSVQAASILGRLTPEGQVRFAAREIQKYNEEVQATKGGLFGLKKKIPELTGEQAQRITDEMKSIGQMVDGEEKAARFQKLQNYVTDLIPSPLINKLTTVWKAGLLTGIKTTGVNIFANVSHFGSEIVKDIPAKVVDSVASLFTGEKTIGLTVKGSGSGLKEGFGKGLKYLRTGYDERNLATKLDYNRINFGKGKIAQGLQAYTNSVFRVLGAEDQPFYYGALARSLADQAKAQAANAKLSGSEAAKFVDNLIQNPTEKMLTYALKDAETAVFQNKTALGEAAKKVQQIGSGAGEFIVPFGRTPSSVAMQIINYSPVGILKSIFQNVGKGKFDQRLFSQGLGRGLTGSGVLALGSLLFSKGMMTLDRPTGEKEQKLWELEGRKPNAIKIGNKWRSIQVLGPLGNVLLVGGHFNRAFKNSGSPSEAFGQAVAGASKSFSEQTFLTGINQVTSAINDPEKSAKSYAGNMLASFIPTLIGDVARSTDKVERRTGKVLDKLQNRIPGLRELLEPQVNVLGKQLETAGNPLEIMIDPTRPTNILTTPVIRELRRLTDAGFPVTPTLLGDKNGYSSLSKEQNTALWKRAGEMTDDKLGKLFAKEQYQTLTDEEKAKVVDEFVSKAKTNARAEVILGLIKDLHGADMKQKLSELKKSGLLSKEVFNQLTKMR